MANKTPLWRTHAITAMEIHQSCSRRHAARLLDESLGNLSCNNWCIVACAVEDRMNRQQFHDFFTEHCKRTQFGRRAPEVEDLNAELADCPIGQSLPPRVGSVRRFDTLRLA